MNEQWALVTHMQFAAFVLCAVQYGELCGHCTVMLCDLVLQCTYCS